MPPRGLTELVVFSKGQLSRGPDKMAGVSSPLLSGLSAVHGLFGHAPPAACALRVEKFGHLSWYREGKGLWTWEDRTEYSAASSA